MEIKHVLYKRTEIQELVESFRDKYVNNNDIPVDIESIMQSSLGMHPAPVAGLYTDGGVDGFMARDLKTVYVDADYYTSDKHYKRVRFTLAHEVGHRILHEGIYNQIKIETLEDWRQFLNTLSEKEIGWFE